MDLLQRIQALSETQRHALLETLQANKPSSNRLEAYVVQEEGACTKGELAEWLQSQVPGYMMPSQIIYLDELPRTPNGKLDTTALTTHDVARNDESEDVAPLNFVENAIAEIWKKLLRVADVSRDDNFFEIGGDSIVGIQVLSLVRQEGILLNATDIGAYPVLKDLAAAASQIKPAEEVLDGHDASEEQSYLFRLDGNGNNMLFAKVNQDSHGKSTIADSEVLSFEGKYTRETTLEELAADYVRMLQEIQPHGPYMFISLDCGAHVTYEVAQQLKQAGEEISFFGVVESAAPIRSSSALSKYIVKGFNYLKRGDIEGIRAGVRLTRQRGIKLTPKKNSQGRDLPFNHGLSINNYLPKPYSGKITIFQSTPYSRMPEGAETTRQWRSLVDQELTVRVIDGEYPLEIMADRYISELADSLPALNKSSC